MIFLRVLSFVGGSFVLFAGPFLLLSDAAGQAAGRSVTTVLAGGLAVLMYALGYYFVAMAGHRAWRSQNIRKIISGLLAFQFIAAASLLYASKNPQVLIATAPLLCLSAFLFMGFVWPGDGGHSHRPMRRREHSALQ